MEPSIHMKPIGYFEAVDHQYRIKVNDDFKVGLTSLHGFSHLQVLWWANLSDTPGYRTRLLEEKPYKKGPGTVGVFATRSQYRPNPILVTTVEARHVDPGEGLIAISYTDAEDRSPILDIKPYHLYERVRDCHVPDWCRHWPQWYEDGGNYDWENEFNF